VGDPTLRVHHEDGVVLRLLGNEMKALLGRPQLVELEQPVDHRPQQAGVGAQELDVVLVELARLGVIDLQEAIGALAGQEDRHVDQRHDAGLLEEVGQTRSGSPRRCPG
jgi:hypothetical protein